MNGPHLLATLSAGLLLSAAPGDRAWTVGRVVPGPAAAAWRSTVPREAFHVFGWVSPPAESTTATRISEMRQAGMNLLLPALEDSGRVADNRARLDLAERFEMQALIWDRRFERVDLDRPETHAVIDSIVADYRHHPAFFGYYLGDEPPRAAFGFGERFYPLIAARDPEHPRWNNLAGRAGFRTREEWLAHHRDYIERLDPDVLCNDQYDFRDAGDRRQFVENAAGLNALSREYGLPFWCIVQLVEHITYRAIGPGELKWQVSILLAYGARGVGYFTYWTPRPDPAYGWKPAIVDGSGRRTPWYGIVAAFNPVVRAAGETLARATWLATVHAGSLPPGGTWFTPNDWVDGVEGRATIGYFAAEDGARLLLVANSDSASARTVRLSIPDAERACVLDERHPTWGTAPCAPIGSDRRLELPLPPGSFALVRLEGGSAGVVAGGAGPRFTARPNPARGEVAFAVQRAAARARLEVVDALGRRAWSAPVARGESTLRWRGERAEGGRAAAGVYFARLEDERGVSVERVVWLGSR